jgi:hypothetical protein
MITSIAAAGLLFGGCSYVCNGSWEVQPYHQPRNVRPLMPAPERPWNYPWEWSYRGPDARPLPVPVFYD